MARKTQDLGRPERIRTDLVNVKQSVSPVTNTELQLSENLSKLMSLAPKAQGLLQQLDVSRQIEEQKLNRQVDDILAQGVTDEELANIVNPAIRNRVKGNLLANSQGQEFITRLNNGEYDDRSREDFLSDWTESRDKQLQNEQGQFDEATTFGFDQAGDIAFEKLNNVFAKRKLDFNQRQSTDARTSNMFNWATSVQDLTVKQIHNQLENDKTFSKNEEGEVVINYNVQQQNQSYFNSVKALAAQGQDISKFIDVAKIPRKDGNSLFSANPEGWTQLERIGRNTTTKKTAQQLKVEAVEVSKLQDEISAGVLNTDPSNLDFKNTQDKIDKFFEGGVISETKFKSLTQSNFKKQTKIADIDSVSNDMIEFLDNKSDSNVFEVLMIGINSKRNTPEGAQRVSEYGEATLNKMLGNNAADKIQRMNLDDEEWKFFKRINTETGYFPPSWKSTLGVQDPNSPQFQTATDLYNNAKEHGFIYKLGLDDHKIAQYENYFMLLESGSNKEEVNDFWVKSNNKEYVSKILTPEITRALSNQIKGSFSEFERPGFVENFLGKDSEFGGFFFDRNINDALHVEIYAERLAKIMLLQNPSGSVEDTINRAVTATMNRIALMPMAENIGIVDRRQKQRAVLVKSGFDPARISKGADDYRDFILDDFKTELEKLDITDIGFDQDVNFSSNGEYILVDQNNRPLSIYGDLGFTVTVNGNFINRFVDEEIIESQRKARELAAKPPEERFLSRRGFTTIR